MYFSCSLLLQDLIFSALQKFLQVDNAKLSLQLSMAMATCRQQLIKAETLWHSREAQLEGRISVDEKIKIEMNEKIHNLETQVS